MMGEEKKRRKPKDKILNASKEFIEARQYIQLTPCKPTDKDTRNYLEKELNMGMGMVETISISEKKAYIDMKTSENKAEKMVVVFQSIDDGEAVFN